VLPVSRALTALGKLEVKGCKRQVATADARETRTSNASLVELKRLRRTRPTTAEDLVAMLKHLEPHCGNELNHLCSNGATHRLWKPIAADVQRLIAGARP
jgi:hypothetical protein